MIISLHSLYGHVTCQCRSVRMYGMVWCGMVWNWHRAKTMYIYIYIYITMYIYIYTRTFIYYNIHKNYQSARVGPAPATIAGLMSGWKGC